MNARRRFWKVLALAVAVALAVWFAAWKATPVRAQWGWTQPVSFPQAAASIVQGQEIRTFLVNRGASPISVQVSTFDMNGTLVQQDAITVQPGTMQFSQVSCSAAPGVAPPAGPCPGVPGAASLSDGSTPLRTEVAIQLTDVPNLLISTAVESVSTGSFGPGPLRALSANHNETLVKDTAPMQ